MSALATVSALPLPQTRKARLLELAEELTQDPGMLDEHTEEILTLILGPADGTFTAAYAARAALDAFEDFRTEWETWDDFNQGNTVRDQVDPGSDSDEATEEYLYKNVTAELAHLLGGLQVATAQAA